MSVVDDLDYLPDPTDSGAHDNGQAPVEMRTARADVDRDPLNYGSDPFPHFQPAPIQLPVEAKSISGLTR
ncbi:hypothetical protein [Kineococcus xinjiangensis]|uniref:hypothetical protein n=1 Tax=Kineococcus xinjiangensis TaxID=512762 RepID=UPI0011B0BFA9|nr:hypothetical protein [Kineococcus xinjiangensis]